MATATLPASNTKPFASSRLDRVVHRGAEHLLRALERAVPAGRDHDPIAALVQLPGALGELGRVALRGSPSASRPRSIPSVNSLRCSCGRSPSASSSATRAGGPGHRWPRRARLPPRTPARRGRASSAPARGPPTSPSASARRASGARRRAAERATPCPRRATRRRSAGAGRGTGPGAWARARRRARGPRRRRSARGPAGRRSASTGAVDSCEEGENSRSDSISSPQYSRRTGRRAVPGNTSRTPPRTANSPRCSITSERR